MQARCPHCRTVFSTERSGVQFCPSCGNQVDVPELGAAPGPAPVAPQPTGGASQPLGTPWERRAELGVVNGLVQTWKETMFQPQPFWRWVAPNGPFADALFYAWILNVIQSVLNIPLQLTSLGAGGLGQVLDRMPNLPPQVVQTLHQAMHRSGVSVVSSTLFGIILFPLVLIIAAGIMHVFCLIFGIARNGYWATFRACAYSTAPWVLNFVPCVSVLAFAYSALILIFGLAAVHEGSMGRAIGAVLVPVIVLPACCCALFIALIGAAAAAQG